MMKSFLFLIVAFALVPTINAQTTIIYANDFEITSADWNTSMYDLPNRWIKNTCAGNGTTFPGTWSMYINPGGAIDGCAINGKERYAYENTPSGAGTSLAYIPIDANCAGNLNLTYDYTTEGAIGEDFVELVYSTDGGSNWIALGGELPQSATWTTTSLSLPSLLYFSNFLIGFRFTFNDITVTGNPPAIDNFVITGDDTIDPVISNCSPDTNMILNSSCSVFVGDMTSLVIATDNCSDASEMLYTQVPSPGTIEFTVPNQSQVFTITVTDVAGNFAQCTFTATSLDTIGPTITCPTIPSEFLNTSCEASIPDITTSIIWSDNCAVDPSAMIFSQSPVAGTLVLDTTIITYSITDPTGNTGTCQTAFNVVDNIAPVVTCPTDQEVPAGEFCFAVLGDYRDSVTVIENCFYGEQVLVTQNPIIGTVLSSPTLITMMGTDESGNSSTCSFSITPIDTTAPSLFCPADMTVDVNASCEYIVANFSGDATIDDNCSVFANMVYNQSVTVGSTLVQGTSSVQLTVMDESGNSSTCSFNLTVTDLSGPTVTCPPSVGVIMDANCSGILGDYSGDITYSDNCSATGSLTLTQSPISGTVISGNTPILITLTDEFGNSSTCNMTAIAIDNIDPTITCPSSVIVSINSSCQYTVPDLVGDLVIDDNCTAFSNMLYSQNPLPGSTDGGLTAVLFTISDQGGNSATCVTMLIPDDTEDPTITCPSPAPVNNASNCDYTLPNYGSQSLILDNCANYTVTQTPAVGSVVQGGDTQIDLEVMDAAGNMAMCSFTLTVFESAAPTITCPSNISTCDPVVNYTDPTFSDNCVATLTQTDLTGYTSGDTFPIGTTILEYTATDASGNSSSCSFNIEILDYPAIANIIEDTIWLCESTSTVVEAVNPTSGTGEWSVLSGQGNFNNQFAFMTGVNNLAYGENVLLFTVSSASCGSTEDTLIVIASQQPLPSSTQDTLIACNDNMIPLLSNVPIYGTGVWTTSDIGVTIADVTSANTTATGMTGGWHDYIWTITNGSCLSTTDTMKVFASTKAIILNADSSICLEDYTLNLVGSIPDSDETSFWSIIQGFGDLSASNSYMTDLTDLSLGAITVIYEIRHDDCPTNADTMYIATSLCDGFNPIFPTVITPNLDGKNDLFEINFLELIHPNCHVVVFNRWGNVVFESTGYLDPWDGTYNGEDLPMGTYFYRIELNDEEGTVYTGPISIIR